jgi:hypothetical protein
MGNKEKSKNKKDGEIRIITDKQKNSEYTFVDDGLTNHLTLNHSIGGQSISKYTMKASLKIYSYYDTYGCCFRSNSCILAVSAMTWSDNCAIASSFILS